MEYVNLICNNCGCEFKRERRRHRANLNKNKNYVPYCSRNCLELHKIKDTKIYNCFNCGKEVKRIISQLENKVFCSSACSATLNNKLRSKRKIKEVSCYSCGEIFQDNYYKICKKCFGYKMNKATANTRYITRSKNEIYFSKLCLGYFQNVGENIKYFDGWDADVLLYDYKIAVHWNGIWHYQKVHQWHNFKKQQANDKIKINKIIEAGWFNYIIVDMGGVNNLKVETEFEKFKQYCEYLTNYIPNYEI